MSPVLRRVVITSALLLSAACSERAAIAPPRPAPPPVPTNAFFTLSDSAPKVGDEVLISAFAKPDMGGPVGSFTARFLYDTLQLRVLAADSVNDGTMRAVNPVPGEYRLAGAAVQGISGGLLFRLRAQVLDRRGLQRMGLLLDELHSIQFTELTEHLAVRDGRDELLVNRRVAPLPPRRERKP